MSIEKLAEQAKVDFDNWCKVTLKSKREALGEASSQVELVKKRVESLYNEIIHRQSDIIKLKGNISYNMGWIATIEKQIADVEDVFGKIYPERLQQLRLDIHSKIAEEIND